MTAEELYNRLKSVKPGAALCTYTMEKVEKMLPLNQRAQEAAGYRYPRPQLLRS